MKFLLKIHFNFFFITLIVITPFFTNAQGFSWAQGFSNVGVGPSIVDANNNVYTVGSFNGTVDFNQGSNIYNITSVANWDMFLLKEDAIGNFLWVKHFPGVGTPNSNSSALGGQAIALDASGNIYITGNFSDTFDFDPGLSQFVLGAPFGLGNAYVLKLNSYGDFIWAKQWGGVPGGGATGYGLKIDSHNIYLAFGFGGTIDADPGSNVYNVTTPSVGGDILIEKLDTSGNFIWAKQLGGTGADGVHMGVLDIDTLSNIYITGRFQSTVNFDFNGGTYNMTSAGGYDVFVAKYDSSGNYLWAKQIGGGNEDDGHSIALDPFGNVAVTGHFGGTVDFDPGSGTYNLTSNSTRSIFTLKLRNNGDFVWAKKAGYNTGLYEGRGITTDTAGNVYVVSNSYPLQKFDSSGNLLWTLATAGTSGWITLDNDNAIYLSGSFSGTQDFDPGPGVFNLTGANNSGFILKLCDSIPPIPLTVSSTTACIGDTVTINAPSFVPLPVIWTQYGVSTPLPDTGLSIKVTTTGLYQIKVANSLCPWMGSVYVHIYPSSNPSISLPPPSGAVWAGQQVSINATVSNFVTAFKIDWYKNGSLLSTTPPQATLLQYTKTAGTDTIKAVVYEWSNPCSVSDTSNVVLVQEALGVADVQKQSLTLYPIPCQDWLYISGVARGDRLLLCDLSGKTVLSATAEGQQQQINTSVLAAGCYMLRVMAINKQTKGALPVVKR